MTRTAAELATVPPVQANMIDLATMGRGSTDHRNAVLAAKGTVAEPGATLTGAQVWGWDESLGVACLVGALDATITLSTTRGYARPLFDIPANFSHLGVTGTLSSGNAQFELTPFEAMGG